MHYSINSLQQGILKSGGAIMKEKKSVPERYPIGYLLRMEQEVIITDPLGSYTGILDDPMDTPVQDVDDL